MDWSHLRIDLPRLLDRLEVLGQVGALSGGGVKRLALSSEDKEGRLLLQSWMEELGLERLLNIAIDSWCKSLKN